MAAKRYRFAIRDRLHAKGLTSAYKVQKAMAKTNSEAGRLLDPDRERITLDVVNELCEFLGCTPGDLFASDKSKK